MSSTRLEGFDYSRRPIGDCDYLLAEIGEGPVVLLLHGFPETHVCWEEVGRELAATHRVLLCDLRGYGGSSAPAGGARGEGFTKREMAAELAQLMSELGHETFAVVGHDRGARVAYRLALDHPRRVSRLGSRQHPSHGEPVRSDGSRHLARLLAVVLPRPTRAVSGAAHRGRSRDDAQPHFRHMAEQS